MFGPISARYEGKYKGLTEFLSERPVPSTWEATFQDIEKVLGFPLPQSARDHQAWWANQIKGHSLAWLSVGCLTSDVNLTDERVNFDRTKQNEVPAHIGHIKPTLTIAEAKERLAQTFGVDPSQIEITIKA